MIGSIDPILAGLSQSAAEIIDPTMKINAAVNYYFMFMSTFMIVLLGTWVTEKIVEPRLKSYEGTAEKMAVNDITPQEKRRDLSGLASGCSFLLLLWHLQLFLKMDCSEILKQVTYFIHHFLTVLLPEF